MTDLTTSVVLQQLGGFPFIDAEFAPPRLLTAAACARWVRAHPGEPATPTADELTEVLDPKRAAEIRRLDLELDLPFGDLSDDELRQVQKIRGDIVQWIPQWEPLVQLPLRFLALQHSAAISSSNFAWPQHIFLAPAAFGSPTTLAEQITHEISHQWLYLIEELWPLQEPGCAVRVTLPSGTPGRSPSELLGASHVAVNLRRLWAVMPATEQARDRRLDHLRQYGGGCRDLLINVRDSLTSDGQALADRLTKELAAL